MNEQEYKEAVNAAVVAAGNGDGLWNTRFIVELYSRKLRLIEVKIWAHRVSQGNWPHLDQEYFLQAPLPMEDDVPTWPE